MRNAIHTLTSLLFVLFLLSMPAFAGHRLVLAPPANDPMGVHIYELDNGLRVYLSENHDTPRFYAEIAVRTGSKNDPPDCTGLAHYLEHLMFKGTQRYGTLDYDKEKAHLDRITDLYEQHFREPNPEKRKAIYAQINAVSQQAAQYAIPNEMDKLYKGIGGTLLNAHTSNEETVYEVNLPANRLEQWAAIESERFSDPVFRLFQPELEVVYEEKNRSMDNKMRVIDEAVSAVLYKHHPYGQQTTLGSIEHLKKPSLVRIREYYDTYYVPNNMAVCVSGDFNTDNAIETIDRYFSVWKPKALPAPKKWKEDAIKDVERVTVKYKGEEYALLAFRTAPHLGRDADALEMMDMVLSNTAAGLIDLNLNAQQKLRSAGAYPEMLNDYGAEFFWGIPKQGQSLDDVERLLLDQVNEIKKGEFEDWVIPAILNDVKKTQKAGLESDVTRVSWMRESFIQYEPWEHVVTKIDRMAKLKKPDIVRVAKKYFSKGYVAGHRLDAQQEVARIEKPAIDAIHIDAARQSPFAAQILAMHVQEMEPTFVDPAKDYQITTLPNGIRFYYIHNPINDLFSFSVGVDIGTWHENRLDLASRLLDKSGTNRLTNTDLKKEWYKLGTTFQLGAGPQETFASISGLDENFEKSLALMNEIMRNPNVDQATLDQLADIVLKERDDARKDIASISSALDLFARYGAESPRLHELPSDEVKKQTVDELQQLTKGLLDYRYTVMYTGTLPMEKVLAALNQYLPAPATLKDPPPYRHMMVQKPAQNEIYFFDKEAAQAQVRISFGGELTAEKDYMPSQLYSSYFGGGMAGVVFQEIREARALAYSAGAAYFRGDREGDQDIMVGAMGTQADKTPEALGAFMNILDQLPVTDTRYATARDALLNGYRASKLGFRQVLPSVRSWERLGLTPDPRAQRFAILQAADLQTMLDFYHREIVGHPKIVSVVGDKKRISAESIGRYGTVHEVGVKDIFVQ